MVLGEVAEWLKAPVLKTGVSQGTAGSNPVLSANFEFLRFRLNLERDFAPLQSRYSNKHSQLINREHHCI